MILLGDSAVGKSKLMERYLKDEYNPRQLSTFALTLFRKNARSSDGTEVKVGELFECDRFHNDEFIIINHPRHMLCVVSQMMGTLQ